MAHFTQCSINLTHFQYNRYFCFFVSIEKNTFSLIFPCQKGGLTHVTKFVLVTNLVCSFLRLAIEIVECHQGRGTRCHWWGQSNKTNFERLYHKMSHKIYKVFAYLNGNIFCSFSILMLSKTSDPTSLVTFENSERCANRKNEFAKCECARTFWFGHL